MKTPAWCFHGFSHALIERMKTFVSRKAQKGSLTTKDSLFHFTHAHQHQNTAFRITTYIQPSDKTNYCIFYNISNLQDMYRLVCLTVYQFPELYYTTCHHLVLPPTSHSFNRVQIWRAKSNKAQRRVSTDATGSSVGGSCSRELLHTDARLT